MEAQPEGWSERYMSAMARVEKTRLAGEEAAKEAGASRQRIKRTTAQGVRVSGKWYHHTLEDRRLVGCMQGAAGSYSILASTSRATTRLVLQRAAQNSMGRENGEPVDHAADEWLKE